MAVSVLTSPLAKQMAEVNRINQLIPGAELRFTGPDRSMASLTLSPELEELRRLEVGTSADALEQIRSRIPLLEMGPITADPEYAKSFYERQLGLVRPEYERKGSELAERLANRGVPVGSDLYSDFFDLEVNRPLERAAAEASLLATTQAGAEARANRAQTLSELAQLMGLAKKETPELTDFFAPSAVDVMGPARMASEEERVEAARLSANEQASKNRRAAEDAQLQQLLIASAGPSVWLADKMGLVEPIGEAIKAGVGKLGDYIGFGDVPEAAASAAPIGADYADPGIGPGVSAIGADYADPGTGPGGGVLGGLPGDPASGVPVSYYGESTPPLGEITASGVPWDELSAAPIGADYADPGIGSGVPAESLVPTKTGAEFGRIPSSAPTESFAGLSPAAAPVVLPAATSAALSVALDVAQGKKRDVAKNAAFTAAGSAIGSAIGVGPVVGSIAGKLAGEAFSAIFPTGGSNTAWESGQASIQGTRGLAMAVGLDPDMLVRESGGNPTMARQIILGEGHWGEAHSGRFPEAAAKLRARDAAIEAERIHDDSIGDA